MSADILRLFEGLTPRQIVELRAQITPILWQLREHIIAQYPPDAEKTKGSDRHTTRKHGIQIHRGGGAIRRQRGAG